MVQLVLLGELPLKIIYVSPARPHQRAASKGREPSRLLEAVCISYSLNPPNLIRRGCAVPPFPIRGKAGSYSSKECGC